MARSRWRDFLHSLRVGNLRVGDDGSSDGALLKRFLEDRQEAAFAQIVRRHGPMVFGVCQRILGHGHDAEDAFQATFLVLVQKASTLSKQEVVGNWLYGVATRTALKAKSLAAQRRAKELAMARPEATSTNPASDWKEVIDQELARLPDKYRIPMVLCELEGKSLSEAAEELQWPEGTVAGRLSRGRQLLKERLLRHGLVLSTGMLATAVVPSALANETVRQSTLLAAGTGLHTVASATIENLTQLVGQEMVAAKFRTTAMIVCGAILVIGTAGSIVWAFTRSDVTNPHSPPSANTKPIERIPEDTIPQEPPVLKDRFGDPLPTDATARLGSDTLRHGGTLGELVFTADGKSLISTGQGWASAVWDPVQGFEQRPLLRTTTTTLATTLSPNGKTLIACTSDKACIWTDVATGHEVHRIELGKRQPTCLAVSPDETRLAMVDGDKVKILDGKGQELREVSAPGGPASLIFSPRGQWLAAPQRNGVTLLLEVESGKVIHQIASPPNANKAIFSLDDSHLLIATSTALQVVNVKTGKAVRYFAQGVGGVTAVALTHDGIGLATANADGRIRLWDWQTGKLIRDITKVDAVRAMVFAPDDQTLALGGFDQTIRLFETNTGRERLAREAPSHRAMGMSLSAKGHLVVGMGDFRFHLWDLTTGEIVRRFGPGSGPPPTCVAISRDGQWVAGPIGSDIVVWDTATGNVCSKCQAKMGVASLAFSPDGKRLAAACRDGIVRLWNPETGAVDIELSRPKTNPEALAFSADGETLVVAHSTGILALWDWHQRKIRTTFTSPSTTTFQVGISADGRSIVTVNADSTIRLWDTETKRERWSIKQTRLGSAVVAISPDGRWVATSERGMTMQLVEASSGKIIHEYHGHRAPISGVTFSPDSKKLYSSSFDTTVLEWDVLTRKP